MLPPEEIAALLARIPDIVYRFRLEPEPGFEYVSPSVFGVTGYTPQDHYDDPELGLKIVHPDDAPLLQALTNTQEEVTAITIRWLHRDGQVFVTEQRVTPLRDDDGRIVALEGVARPVVDEPEKEFRVRAGDLVLDLAGHRVLVDERVIKLTPAEHRILALLATSEGPVEGSALVTRLWGKDQAGGDRAIQVHISKLRRKIEDDPRRPRRLVTHRGLGYALAR